MSRQSVGSCRVPGCTEELPDDRGLFKRYRVCKRCYSLPSLELGGQQVRFCRLCRKFQPLEDFSGDRVNCRRVLEQHNARRRSLRALSSSAQRDPAARGGGGGGGAGGAEAAPHAHSQPLQAARLAGAAWGAGASRTEWDAPPLEAATSSEQGSWHPSRVGSGLFLGPLPEPAASAAEAAALVACSRPGERPMQLLGTEAVEEDLQDLMEWLPGLDLPEGEQGGSMAGVAPEGLDPVGLARKGALVPMPPAASAAAAPTTAPAAAAGQPQHGAPVQQPLLGSAGQQPLPSTTAQQQQRRRQRELSEAALWKASQLFSPALPLPTSPCRPSSSSDYGQAPAPQQAQQAQQAQRSTLRLSQELSRLQLEQAAWRQGKVPGSVGAGCLSATSDAIWAPALSDPQQGLVLDLVQHPWPLQQGHGTAAGIHGRLPSTSEYSGAPFLEQQAALLASAPACPAPSRLSAASECGQIPSRLSTPSDYSQVPPAHLQMPGRLSASSDYSQAPAAPLLPPGRFSAPSEYSQAPAAPLLVPDWLSAPSDYSQAPAAPLLPAGRLSAPSDYNQAPTAPCLIPARLSADSGTASAQAPACQQGAAFGLPGQQAASLPAAWAGAELWPSGQQQAQQAQPQVQAQAPVALPGTPAGSASIGGQLSAPAVLGQGGWGLQLPASSMELQQAAVAVALNQEPQLRAGAAPAPVPLQQGWPPLPPATAPSLGTLEQGGVGPGQ